MNEIMGLYINKYTLNSFFFKFLFSFKINSKLFQNSESPLDLPIQYGGHKLHMAIWI